MFMFAIKIIGAVAALFLVVWYVEGIRYWYKAFERKPTPR